MSFDFVTNEKKILKFWQDKKIFKKLQQKNRGQKRWSFLDGPITANNPMGVHHAWGRTYKDLFQRYNAMKGFDQRYQNGFDCQGLWVEVEVEKEKGFKNKKDIERFGIDKFVKACKERVLKYSKIQTEQSIRLGQFMDWDNSYFTMSDKNNYTIWNFLKVCHKKGLLYKGHDSVPWCPRCGTAISQHEILTEEYKEITHQSIYFQLPVKGKKNTYFLIWTTTPWTLPGNVALAVHPKLIYVKIKKNNSTYIILKGKAGIVDGDITEEFPGKKLEGLKYKGMFDDLSGVKEHKIILWKDVTEEEGTGIVHIAPGCGAEDFKLSKELDLPVVDLSNDESNYRKEFGKLAGKFVGSEEVRKWIFKDLTKKGFVFKIEDYVHRYPTCWRCKTELIFRVVDEWYISMDKIRKDLMKVAKQIKWVPGFGLDRELDWLKNMHDWLISKKRYWGLALPIYECECGNFDVIGSKEELKKKAVSGWKKFGKNSPHRPWIDEVKIKCSQCNKEISRIKDVGNPWLDAGIVPFSTMEKEWFPAELICESFPGQFKNWFYALIVMSTVLENTNPVKTIFGFASVKDEKGEEMHKSKGNAVWFDEAVEKIGADPMRWMYMRQNPINDLKFGLKTAEEIKRKLLTLCNVYSFFGIYVDKKDFPKKVTESLLVKSDSVTLDKWIVSRFNNLIKKVSKNLDEYNAGTAILAIENFFIEDLSLWYVRRSRKRFRQGETDTFYYVLLNLTKLIAPAMPFLAEKMYGNLKVGKMPESVHLSDWPKVGKTDNKLEEKMQKVREIVTSALAKRADLGIKVRQPLASLQIPITKKQIPNELLELIKEEVNVKKITFGKSIKLNTKITEELRKEGEHREMVRNVNKIRKEMGLTPKDIVVIDSTFDVINKEGFRKEVGAKKFNVKKKVAGKEVEINKEKCYIKIIKI